MDHRDIALQQTQDIISGASETMAQARTALSTKNINEVNQAKLQVDQSEVALQHTYQVVQQLYSEGKASFVDFQNVQQVVHQLANLKYRLNHLTQEGGR
jgi:hypothetical protein